MVKRDTLATEREFRLVAVKDATSKEYWFEIVDFAGVVKGTFPSDGQGEAYKRLHELAHESTPECLCRDGGCSVWKVIVNGKTLFVVMDSDGVRTFGDYGQAMALYRDAIKRARDAIRKAQEKRVDMAGDHEPPRP
jgi:hypothetical protein